MLATAMQATLDVARAAEVSVSDVNAIGIGIPGTVDPVSGTVRFAVNVGIGRDDLDLGPRLTDELGVGVHVENDVRAAALGADWYLSNEFGPVNDLAYLSIGTGIAAGYVEHGRLRRGNTLVAGEIGHIPIDPNGPLCACGQVGCIEAISSGSAIERMWPTEKGCIGRRTASRCGGRGPERPPLVGRCDRWTQPRRAVAGVDVGPGGHGAQRWGRRSRQYFPRCNCRAARQRCPTQRVPRLARSRRADAGDRSVDPARADRRGPRRARGAACPPAMTSLAVRGGSVDVVVDGTMITAVDPPTGEHAVGSSMRRVARCCPASSTCKSTALSVSI